VPLLSVVRIDLPGGKAILPKKLVIRLQIPKECIKPNVRLDRVVEGHRCLRVAAPLIFPESIQSLSEVRRALCSTCGPLLQWCSCGNAVPQQVAFEELHPHAQRFFVNLQRTEAAEEVTRIDPRTKDRPEETIEQRSAAAMRHVQSVLPGHSTSEEAAAEVMVKKEDAQPGESTLRAVGKSFFKFSRAVINNVFAKHCYLACTEKTGMLNTAPLVYLVSRCRLSCHWPCPIA
jgi:hypothetical protein